MQLEIAHRLGLLGAVDQRRLQSDVAEIGRMLNGLIDALQPADGW